MNPKIAVPKVARCRNTSNGKRTRAHVTFDHTNNTFISKSLQILIFILQDYIPDLKLSRKAVAILSLVSSVIAVAAVLIFAQTAVSTSSSTTSAPNAIASSSTNFLWGKITAIRTPENVEIKDVSKRAEYLSVSNTVLNANPKLMEVLAGADRSHDIDAEWRSSGSLSPPPAPPLFEVYINEDEANKLISAWSQNFIPSGIENDEKVSADHVIKLHSIKIQVDGKFYLVLIYTAYKQ